jgi:formylglycine-generating enzyme required for sulfatase activity
MGGNVREWVISGRKRSNAGEGKAFNRGGSWVMSAAQLSTSHTRIADSVTEKRHDLGFRCAVSL